MALKCFSRVVVAVYTITFSFQPFPQSQSDVGFVIDDQYLDRIQTSKNQILIYFCLAADELFRYSESSRASSPNTVNKHSSRLELCIKSIIIEADPSLVGG